MKHLVVLSLLRIITQSVRHHAVTACCHGWLAFYRGVIMARCDNAKKTATNMMALSKQCVTYLLSS